MNALARLRYEIGSRRPRNRPTPSRYRRQLLELLHAFVAERTDAALPLDEFVILAEGHLGLVESRAVNRYVADLWNLFAPDYRDRLPEYYEALALPSLMRFVDYASDDRLIRESYLKPYELAADAIPGPLRVLEVGGGLPHGLIRYELEHPGRIEEAAINDLDAPYTHFATWFCERRGIASTWIPAIAGRTSDLPVGRFNIVFAKDVLEHVFDPELMLARIVSATAAGPAVIAVDLGERGARIYQHVSPDLSGLRSQLTAWRELEAVGTFTVFARQ